MAPATVRDEEGSPDVARAPAGDGPSPGAGGLRLREERGTTPGKDSGGVTHARRGGDRGCGCGPVPGGDEHDTAAAGRDVGAGRLPYCAAARPGGAEGARDGTSH